MEEELETRRVIVGEEVPTTLILPVADEEEEDEEEKEEESCGRDRRDTIESLTESLRSNPREAKPKFNPDTDLPKWRKVVRGFVLHPVFDRVIVAVIVVNCITLAFENPTQEKHATIGNRVAHYVDMLLTVVFTGEVALKVAGLGLFHPSFQGSRTVLPHSGGYFRSWWNILDFVISAVSLAALGDSQYSGFRAFRLLRLLRAVSFSSSVRILVNALVASLSKLVHVFLLYLVFLVVLSVVGVQLWKGRLRMRCVASEAVSRLSSSGLSTYLGLYRSLQGTEEAARLFPEDLLDTVCHPVRDSTLGGFSCPWGYECVPFQNAGRGFQSFDNVAVAALSLFVAVTLEGWTDLMYRTQDATNFYAFMFFVVLIAFGSFFIINLTLVIISYAFESEHEKESRRAKKTGRVLLGGADDEVVPAGYTKTWKFKLRKLKELFAHPGLSKGSSCEVKFQDRWIPGKVPRNTDGPLPAVASSREMLPVEIEHPRSGEKVVILARLSDVVLAAESPFRARLRRAVRSPAFNFLVIALILLNVLALAVDHHGQPKEMTLTLDVINIVVASMFAIEMTLKLVAFGVMGYIKDPGNLFDGAVTIISLLDILITSGPSGEYSALRSLRVLRVFKLARWFHLLRRWILIIIRSLRASAVLSFLILLLVFSYALIGMQIMGGHFCNLDDDCVSQFLASTPKPEPEPECPCVPRANFDSVGSGMLTMFQILTGEDWNQIMYDGMAGVSVWTSFFFVSFFFVGNYLLLNLFVAILLHQSAFVTAEEKKEAKERKRAKKVRETATDSEMQMIETLQAELGDPRTVPLLQAESPGPQKEVLQLATGIQGEAQRDDDNPKRLQRAFFFLDPENRARLVIRKVVEHSAFEAVVILVILVSTIALGLENPFTPPDSALSVSLEKTDYVITAFFTAEAALKIFAYGFFLHETSYIRRDPWTVLDFAIVLCSLVSLGVEGEFNVFRVLRAFRPLRFVNKSQGLKIVLASLLRSIPAMANVFFISLLLWVVWGIMGVQLFQGSFYSCTHQTWGDLSKEVFTVQNRTFALKYRTDCEDYSSLLRDSSVESTPVPPGGFVQWQDYPSSFNHLGAACLALFEIASLEGWVSMMYLGMDSVSFDESPQLNHRPLMSLFFVGFIVVGSFFVMNLFISVLLDTYYTEEQKKGGERFLLTEGQKNWVQSYREMLRGVERPPDFFYALEASSAAVRICRKMVQNRWFEVVVQVSIVANVLVLATEHYGQGPVWRGVQDFGDWVFIAIFTLEAVIKMTAFGLKGYFEQNWNRFDFFILGLSWVGAVVTLAGITVGATASVFRILRLTRLLRLVKKAKGINVLLKTLFLALPSIINVSGILTGVFVIYAALGVRLFGRVSPGQAINRNANFSSFPDAVLTLFRISTGESWQVLMADCRRSPPECDTHLGGCASKALAVLFFTSFMIGGMYVLLNLFIAVILDSFDEVVKDARAVGDIRGIDMRNFRTAWNKRDPHGTYRMDAIHLPVLLKEVGPPLGVPKTLPYSEVQDIVADLDLYCIDGKVDMQPFLQALFCRLHGSPEELMLPEILVHTVVKKADLRFQSHEREERYNEEGVQPVPIHLFIAVIKAQAAVRGMLVRQSIRRSYIKQEAKKVYKVEHQTPPSDAKISPGPDGSMVILPVLE